MNTTGTITMSGSEKNRNSPKWEPEGDWIFNPEWAMEGYKYLYSQKYGTEMPKEKEEQLVRELSGEAEPILKAELKKKAQEIIEEAGSTPLFNLKDYRTLTKEDIRKLTAYEYSDLLEVYEHNYRKKYGEEMPVEKLQQLSREMAGRAEPILWKELNEVESI